jgi:hypothetical protein
VPLLLTNILSFLILFSTSSFAYTDFSKVDFKFLSSEESSVFLSTPDDFINSLTTLDLSLHHETSATLTIDYQLEFLKHTTLSWTPAEIVSIKSEIEIMKKAINDLDLDLNLPSEIKLIKTNGEDEFHAHYTRSNAIIFPINKDFGIITTDAPTVFHETFHILSRFNPNLMDQLYAVCNFKKIPQFEIPKSIHNIALTNPDAFHYQHAITVTASGREIDVIPFFYSALKQGEINGPIEESKTFKLGLVDISTLNDEAPKFYKTAETDYKLRAQVNSTYYIHPEEIMAENFRLLLMKAAKTNPMPAIKYPDVLERLTQILK